MSEEIVGLRIYVGGIVQGVGFRPFVYSLAGRYNLTGWVRNTSRGVEIEINGPPESVQKFADTLRTAPPPLARIDRFETEPSPPNGAVDFLILASQPHPGDFLPVSPDMTICPDCQRELFDPTDRRYRYPFINCTNCGPRFTIVQDIPYDRPQTTMAGFPLCPDCAAQYHDPSDRRFHAQPIACPRCGPAVWLEMGGQKIAAAEAAIQAGREMLCAGKILAIKGLGGFHLACDATNPQAVAELRRRKKRSDKPFALMAFDLAGIEHHCRVSEPERDLLLSRQRPIVLLERKSDSPIAPAAAPGQTTLGFMLAYTPLHLLLLENGAGYPDALVMTSGNLSEEPIAYQDGEARERLRPLADAYLLHNRGIHMRVDDSVVRSILNRPYLLRRARGYAPDPIPMPVDLPPILATGAELKNTFCLTRERYAFLSHHIGDLENYETLASFEAGITHYERLFRIKPERIVCDLHPDYLATRYAVERARTEQLPLIQVQHHHAHLAACLADNGWAPEAGAVIGLSLDGTGLGPDGAIWGGEILVGGYQGYERRRHLKYVPLPGGDLSVRKPARMALAHLWAAGIEWEPALPPLQAICAEERTALRSQLERGLNSRPTSSMGRLFDAAAALIGVAQLATYEGQAAIQMEALADPEEQAAYPFGVEGDLLDPAPLWARLLVDWHAGITPPVLAARFHNSIAAILVDCCQVLRQETGIKTVAFSGGVWQNRYLLERTYRQLDEAGFTVLLHRQIPTNDGGLALGQAMIAATTG
ncbi:MAG TPA: carbamoyltransferase HypF [Anaerolineaceae bacterium]|nr:carbamoyltransferase HypF [Anaerolineaceae bacterium]